MSSVTSTAARPGRRSSDAAAVALAALSAAAALGFDREFRDGSYVLPVLGAAVLPHAIAWFGRRRGWPLAAQLAGSAAALVVLASWIAAGSAPVLGLPAPATPAELVSTTTDGWTVLRTGIAPVAVTPGVVLLCVLAVWVTAAVADVLAFAAGASIGAIVPSLVVFVVASSLGPRDLRVVSTVAFLGAALAFLALCHRELLEQRRAWFTRRPGTSGPTGRGVAAGIGLVALAAGLLIGPALPGADDPPLLDYKRHTGRAAGYRSRVNPLVDIKSRLTSQRDEPLFTVRAPVRLAWRLVALDRFDGTQWTLSSASRAAGRALPGARPGTVRQRFDVVSLDERWLPAAYEPVAVSLRDALVVPESRTLVHAGRSMVGLGYTVDSEVPPEKPTPTQIIGTAAPPPATLRPYLDLPADFPAGVRGEARRVTAASATPYARAEALAAYFTDGRFTYDLDVPPGADQDAIVEFLRIRRGFCEQFAGTYAAMARSVGLPARVAVGFTPGTYDAADRVLRVTGRNAHAWPEVWFAGLGWTRFEPTPAGPEPGAADPIAPGAPMDTPAPVSAAAGSSPTTTTRIAPSSRATATTTPSTGTDSGVSVTVRPDPRRGGTDRTAWVAGTVVALVVALIVARAGIAAIRRMRRRAARRRGTDPRDAVVGAWAEALDRLDEHGMSRARWRTPHEVAAAALDERDPVPSAAEPLARLADATTEALWASGPPMAAAAADAWNDLEALERVLRVGTPRAARIRARVRRSLSAPSRAPDAERV